MKTVEELIKIVSFGGGVILDTSLATEQLIKIASFAKSTGARITIKKAEKLSTEELIKIASFAPGLVQYDFGL